MQALLAALGWLPLAANRAVGAALGTLLSRLPNRTREVARRNLELCFPELESAARARLLRAFLADTGRGLAELALLWCGAPSRVLPLARRVHGHEQLERALAAGSGVLVLSPHLGSWEWLVFYLAAQGECTFVYREPKDPGIDRIVTAARARSGATLVQAGAHGVRAAFRALKRGHLVGLMPDQQPKRGQGEFAPFFGIPALTMVLASRLARRSDAAVLLGTAIRLPGARGFEVHFESADERIRDPDLAASTAALNAQIEALIRRWPEQYQWGYKRFSIRPPGQAKLY